MTDPPLRTFVFDTSNAALWAEEVAREAGIPVEVVPAPAASSAKCDLALITRDRHAVSLADALSSSGVPFRRWPDGADAAAPQ